jgi:hypothetical protein
MTPARLERFEGEAVEAVALWDGKAAGAPPQLWAGGAEGGALPEENIEAMTR